MSKILSWDVGIKNMAYCVLEKKEENFKILKWGIINVSEETNTCQCTLRGGKQCGKKAKFKICHSENKLFENFEDGMYLCEKHVEKETPTLQEIEKPPTKKNNKQKIEKMYCCVCNKTASLKINNTTYCWCKDHEKNAQKFEKNIKIKKISVKNCNKQDVQITAEILFKKLDEISELLNVDTVLIENQPAVKNPIMKRIAAMLYSYFIIRGVMDKKGGSIITNVKFVSPSNKLKVNEETTNKKLKQTEKNKIYKMTKKMGIKYCKSLIDENDLNELEKYSKKDDLCDAFLQGFKYIFNVVPQKYFEKLKLVGFD